MRTNPVHANRALLHVATAVAMLTLATTCHAGLTVTPAQAGRFSLTDYATGFNFNPGSTGPVGIAFRPGADLVTESYLGSLFLYSLPNTGPYAVVPTDQVRAYVTTPPAALAQVQINGVWHYYTSSGSTLDFIEIDPTDGHVLRTLAGAGGHAMAPYPASAPPGPYSGHILVSAHNAAGMLFWDVDPDPAVWSATALDQTSGLGANNGVAFSPDGSRLYFTRGDSLYGLAFPGVGLYLAPGSFVAPSYVGEGYAGIAVGVGSLEGYVYVNTHAGNVYEFGLPATAHAGEANLIASGGSRGDLIAVDPNVPCGGAGGYPSLLITQEDRVLRLDPPGGGWFGPPTSSLLPVTAAVPAAITPGRTTLSAIVPNPTSGTARIEFALGRQGAIHLGIVDILGREVAVLAAGPHAAGTHAVVWDGTTSRGRATAGIYFVHLRVGGQVLTRRLAVMR